MNGGETAIMNKIIEIETRQEERHIENTAIMNKIIEIETRQEERHIENKLDIGVIFKKLSKLDTLPCDVHVERMKWLNRYMIGIAGILTMIICLILKLHAGV